MVFLMLHLLLFGYERTNSSPVLNHTVILLQILYHLELSN